jgi:hypothetical protein
VGLYSGGVAAFVFYKKVYKINVATVFPALWSKLCKNSFYLPGVCGKEGRLLCLPVARKLYHCWHILLSIQKKFSK